MPQYQGMTNKPRSCGSKPGNDPSYMATANKLAHALHAANATLVYGGGMVGLMGEVARTMVKLSGPQSVHGIIPRALVSVSLNDDKEGGKSAERTMSASELEKSDGLINGSEYGMTTVVPDMHTRKRLMAKKVIEGGPGSGFIALPGGYGTLEEVMEIVTWNQLGIHTKGIVLLNVGGYWDGVKGWVGKSVEAGFVSGANAGILVETDDCEKAVKMLANYQISEHRFKLDWGTA